MIEGEEEAFKENLDDWLDKTVKKHKKIKNPYFATLLLKPNKDGIFTVYKSEKSRTRPLIVAHSVVLWVVNPIKRIEVLWCVSGDGAICAAPGLDPDEIIAQSELQAFFITETS